MEKDQEKEALAQARRRAEERKEIVRRGEIMSKIVSAVCKITQADPGILKKAVDTFMKHHDGTVKQIDDHTFEITSQELSTWNPVRIREENGELNITGDDMDIDETKQVVEQYYMAQEMAEEYHSEVEMDEEGDLMLVLEVE